MRVSEFRPFLDLDPRDERRSALAIRIPQKVLPGGIRFSDETALYLHETVTASW